MKNNESNHESEAQVALRAEDRRAFMKAAVKTVVAGTAVVGIAACASEASAQAAGALTGACGELQPVPDAVVKARVLLNNRMDITRDQILEAIGTIFDGSCCPTCGLGGFPGPFEPGTVTEIAIETAFLADDQPAAVIYSPAAAGF